MDIVMKCLTDCFRTLFQQLLWMVVLAVLFALLVLFFMMGGFDLNMFRDIVISALAGMILISLICCLCCCAGDVKG